VKEQNDQIDSLNDLPGKIAAMKTKQQELVKSVYKYASPTTTTTSYYYYIIIIIYFIQYSS
jgi:hypothetical protein